MPRTWAVAVEEGERSSSQSLLPEDWITNMYTAHRFQAAARLALLSELASGPLAGATMQPPSCLQVTPLR